MAENQARVETSLLGQLVEWLIRTNVSDQSEARRSRLLSAIMILSELLTIAAVAVAIVLQTGEGGANSSLLASRGLILGIAWAIIYIINRRGRSLLAGSMLSVITLGVNVMLVNAYGPLSPSALGLIISVVIAGFFAPPFVSFGMAILAIGSYIALNLQVNSTYFDDIIKGRPAAQTLVVYANMLFVAVLGWLVSRTNQDTVRESRELSLALVSQRRMLEDRLVLQTRQLQATTAVARAIAGTRDLNKLLEDSVRLIRETFGYYHVQVFLVEEAEGYAILRQSTGEVGDRLLARGHKLAIGSLSVIGQVTASAKPVIARDTDTDFVHRRNELLPNTRSEMAVPLIVGDRVIGALDMQSTEPNAFLDEMTSTFQALADQLAIAIENARLFEQVQESLRELKELSQETTQRSWATFLSEARDDERRYSHGPETKALELHRSRVAERVLSAGAIIVSTGKDGRQAFLAAPIVVRNEIVGVLGVEPDSAREWTQEDLALLQSIAERTALAVENARLYLQAQRAAERESLINNIASRLQRAPSLAMLLETAAKELAAALGTENVYAEISMDHPMAETRKEIMETDTDREDAASDVSQSSAGELPAPDQSEEARA